MEEQRQKVIKTKEGPRTPTTRLQKREHLKIPPSQNFSNPAISKFQNQRVYYALHNSLAVRCYCYLIIPLK
jgi:hypothetical protein